MRTYDLRGATIFVVLLIAVAGFTGCKTIQLPAAPGIQPAEEAVLTKSYYWRRGIDPVQFSDGEIQRLFVRTREVPPDEHGEHSEILGSQLIWALAAAGDTRFAALLSLQPHDIQIAVSRYIQSAWTYDHLNYPETQTLAKNYGADL